MPTAAGQNTFLDKSVQSDEPKRTRRDNGRTRCFCIFRFCIYADHSPGKYSLVACLTAEVVFTFMFLFIILGSTDRRAPQGFAPLAIGLGLTLINLIGIPVTNLSVNPARSTGPAVFVGGWALAQLWLFWVAPIVGAARAGVVYRTRFGTEPTQAEPTAATERGGTERFPDWSLPGSRGR
jgi:aquaporin Z